MPINLFVDANVLLQFYAYPEDALEELKKVTAAMKSGEIRFFMNDQLFDEYLRNRETKILGAIRDRQLEKVPQSYPQLVRNLKGFDEVLAIAKELDKKRQALLDRALTLSATGGLIADILISDIFGTANLVMIDDGMVAKADLRARRGNPPGKKDSLGDALHWEFLLSNVPNGEDLNLVTGDKDFASKLDPYRVSDFLKNEWEAAKKSKIQLFTGLGTFFKEKFPKVTLAAEIERKATIDALAYSGSFLNTHQAIGLLESVTNFTDNEVRRLCEAAVSNSQIAHIASDPDVRDFYKKLTKDRDALLGPDLSRAMGAFLADE